MAVHINTLFLKKKRIFFYNPTSVIREKIALKGIVDRS